MNNAQKEAFKLVSETCPAIDAALSDLEGIIKKQTKALRDALIDKISELHDAEFRISELEDKFSDANNRIYQLEMQLNDATA